jgi:hypothetical protein
MEQTTERARVVAALELADDYGMDVLPDDQIDLLMDFALALAGRTSTVLAFELLSDTGSFAWQSPAPGELRS